jgi:hypothetical protein
MNLSAKKIKVTGSLPTHTAVRNNFIDSSILILPSPASGRRGGDEGVSGSINDI